METDDFSPTDHNMRLLIDAMELQEPETDEAVIDVFLSIWPSITAEEVQHLSFRLAGLLP